MTGRRIEAGTKRPPAVTFVVDGETVAAYPGESVATALLAAGRRATRLAADDDPRGPFCNMGVCYECLVVVDDLGPVRACMTAVREGLRVSTASP